MGSSMDGWRKVAEPGVLNETEGRLHLIVEGRYVSLIRSQGRTYCIDAICFHAGGPLALGDIEEVNGAACLVCPWHLYHVSLESGEKYYQDASRGPDGALVAGGWKSVGQRQRTHEVDERPDGIYIRISSGGTLASDEYACRAECGERVRRNFNRTKSPVPGGSPGRRGLSPPRSPSLRASAGAGEDVWPEDLVLERADLNAP